MKITHSKPKGQRILKSTHKYSPLWIEPEESNYWFIHEIGEWSNKIPTDKSFSSIYYSVEHNKGGNKDIWSLKAAIRRIKKWNIPKGTVFHVILPYVGHEFKITK